MEVGVRALFAQFGLPMTKERRGAAGAGVVLGMGDILGTPEITALLGRDFVLHLRTLYCDPRGCNLRNEIAHGLFPAEKIGRPVACRIVHSFLALGIWRELSQARKGAESNVN